MSDWIYIDEATAPEFENGWTNAPNPQGPRVGETLFDHVDRHLKALEGESFPSSIFTLPPGYRPDRRSRYYFYRQNAVPRWKRVLLEARELLR